jgi:hypothetical protein
MTEELEFAGSMPSFELLEKEATEQTREHSDGQEESRPARDPTLAIWRYPATRNDAVGVRMVIEILPPGVQHGGDADLRSESPSWQF